MKTFDFIIGGAVLAMVVGAGLFGGLKAAGVALTICGFLTLILAPMILDIRKM